MVNTVSFLIIIKLLCYESDFIKIIKQYYKKAIFYWAY